MRLSQSSLNLMVVQNMKQSSDSLYNTKEKQYYLKMWPIVLTRQVLSLSILLQRGRHYKAEEKNSVH